MFRCLIALLAPFLMSVAWASTATSVDVESVWAGHPVGFAFLTHENQQFVAYYDAQRQMTLAQRELPEGAWQFKKLDSHVGWDSHNEIKMILDRDLCLHVSGNMHVNPLVYFRGSSPLDIQSVEPIHQMTGQHEDRVTYPVFLMTGGRDLIFWYRNGRSGDGSTWCNRYDHETRSWAPLMDSPLFDGRGEMNAYPHVPVLGPDGYYHLSWVWRDTHMAETCHSLSYARSRDLVKWESADGRELALPLTVLREGAVIDPIPVNGGIINGSGKIGFAPDGTPLMAYHKFDEAGNTQLYLAVQQEGQWSLHQLTQWTQRIEFLGGGSLHVGFGHSEPRLHEGRLVISFRHPSEDSGNFVINTADWTLGEKVSVPSKFPRELAKVRSDFPEMRVNWRETEGQAADGNHYFLRWETLPPHRDRPRPEPWPAPSMMQVITVPAEAP